MADPTLELQRAVVAALNDPTPVAAGGIHDRVPSDADREALFGAAFPYVSLGNWQTIGDGNSCFRASEVLVSIDVWSRGVGRPEAREIAATVRDRLDADLDLGDDFRIGAREFVTIRDVGDPDGLTTHLAVELRFLIDHDNA